MSKPRKGCPSYTGWTDEGLSYCDREVGPEGTHDGLHSYPITHVVQTASMEDVMEEVLKKLIEMLSANLKITEQLVEDLKAALPSLEAKPEVAAPKKERRKKGATEEPATAPAVTEPVKPAEEPKPHSEGGALLVKDVTIEMLREMATKFSAAFGMEKLLELNVKHGGAKKLSGIDPKMYGVLYGTMASELAKASEKAISEGAALLVKDVTEKPSLTIEHVREKAAAFLTANGQPALAALLKAFGASKISELAKEKYPAFIEAISNA